MKKKNFVTLELGVVLGLLFGVGMCMCLLPEWNSFTEGVIVASIGGVGLLALGGYRFLSDGKKISVNWKLLGKIAFGIVGALVLGLGMCLAMKVIFASISYMMFVGIAVGLVGILMVSVNYFWYKNILASRKKKYAPRILALADELLGNQA